MMLQLVLIALFILNMILIWLTVLTKKFEWYRIPGILIFSLVPFSTVFFAQPRFELDFFWWRIAGIAAIVVGFGIMGWARVVFSPQALVTSGPYQFIRHPQYLGLIFMWMGWWWIWVAVYAFYFGMFILALTWIQAYLEEKFILEKKFGDQYLEYRHQTGMFWIK